ncbi:hypothetical protein FACS1894164_14880 [Spirochaetia bacterium]|nr:hypothetical protein FACS1894164_14880 [Spirochaetia bacterium]
MKKIIICAGLCVFLLASCDDIFKDTVEIEFRSLYSEIQDLPAFSELILTIDGKDVKAQNLSSTGGEWKVLDITKIEGSRVKAIVDHASTDSFPFAKSFAGTVTQSDGSYVVDLQLSETAIIVPTYVSSSTNYEIKHFPDINGTISTDKIVHTADNFGFDFDPYGRLITAGTGTPNQLNRSLNYTNTTNLGTVNGTTGGIAYNDGMIYFTINTGSNIGSNKDLVSLAATATSWTSSVQTPVITVNLNAYTPVAVYKDDGKTFAFAAESGTATLVKFNVKTGIQVVGTSFSFSPNNIQDLKIIRDRLYILFTDTIGSLSLLASTDSKLESLTGTLPPGRVKQIVGWDDDSFYVLIDDGSTTNIAIVRILTGADGAISVGTILNATAGSF